MELDWDIRTVKRWCHKNGVGILSDEGSNRQYVLKVEFDAGQMRAPIKYLTEKYGANKLPEILKSSISFFAQVQTTKAIKSQRHATKGENEKSFLSILQTI